MIGRTTDIGLAPEAEGEDAPFGRFSLGANGIDEAQLISSAEKLVFLLRNWNPFDTLQALVLDLVRRNQGVRFE